jgi:hypothetical protein
VIPSGVGRPRTSASLHLVNVSHEEKPAFFGSRTRTMSLLNLVRPKWKHSDPSIRAEAIRALTDQDQLEKIFDEDPAEEAKAAAVQALTDEDILVRIACTAATHAQPALERLKSPKKFARVALMAETRAIRELAVDHIDDGVLLHRISVCDTDAWIRLKARLKSLEPNQTRDVIRHYLSKLEIADDKAPDMAEFTGTRDEVCATLLRDRRFRINGGVDDNEPTTATISELDMTPAVAGGTAWTPAPKTWARFLAFKRGETGDAVEATRAKVYFEIMVWRTGEDAFAGCVEEKRLELTRNIAVWSRVSNRYRNTNVTMFAQPDQPTEPEQTVSS